ANAIASGAGTKIDDGKADALGFGEENLVGIGEAGGKGVDEDVAVVAFVELDFTANGGHAKGVAIAADAGDDARNQMTGLFVAGFAKAQGVHGSDRARAHGEYVAQDAADAGRC